MPEDIGIQISNALMIVITLLASFIAAGVFTDPSLLKNGVPQGIFNALCLFISALFCAIYTLMLASAPVNKNSSEKKIKDADSFTKELFKTLLSWRTWLFFSASLLVAGLSVVLLQVVCVQFTNNLVSNCQQSSWGIIGFLIYIVGGVPAIIWIMKCRLFCKRSKSKDTRLPQIKEASEEQLQLILKTLLTELDRIVDKKLNERITNP